MSYDVAGVMVSVFQCIVAIALHQFRILLHFLKCTWYAEGGKIKRRNVWFVLGSSGRGCYCRFPALEIRLMITFENEQWVHHLCISEVQILDG